MSEEDFDFGGESSRLGGVQGVLRLKDGEETTLLVTGPLKEVLDRFGNQEPTTKIALGVYDCDHRSRAIVVLSWKAKKDWDGENAKRPFKTHFVRWKRNGTTKENTVYGVNCFPGVTPAHWAEAKAAPPLPLGSFEATCAEIERRAKAPRRADAEGAAQTGYDHPGKANGSHAAPPAAAPGGHVPIPQAPGAAPAGINPALAGDLDKADSWLQAPGIDLPKLSAHVKEKLLAAVGKDNVVTICKKVGIVPGGAPPTADQLRAAIREALALLRPVTAGIGVGEDDIPF